MPGVKDAVVGLSWNHKVWKGYISGPQDACIKYGWPYVQQAGEGGEWWNFNMNQGFPNQYGGRVYGYASMGASNSTDCITQKKNPVFNGSFPQGDGIILFVSTDVHTWTGRMVVGFYGKAIIHGLERLYPELICPGCNHIFRKHKISGVHIIYTCISVSCKHTIAATITQLYNYSINCPVCNHLIDELWCNPFGPPPPSICRNPSHGYRGPHVCITSKDDSQIPLSNSPQMYQPILSGEIAYSTNLNNYLDAKSLIPCITKHTRKVHFPYLIDRKITIEVLQEALSKGQDAETSNKVRTLLEVI